MDIRGRSNKREIWCVDAETDPFKPGRAPRPFLWGAYNGTEYHEFTETSDMLEFITSRKCIAYAHNGGKFDWMFFLDKLEPHTPLMVINGRLSKFKIGDAEFRDSFNIFPAALKAGGKKFEIEDFSIFEKEHRDKPANREIIKERLRTDCIYLYEIVETFINEFGLHLTQASASVHAWTKIANIEKPATTRQFYKTFEPYYYGGRVECFESGIVQRRFKIIDINSAYPAAMCKKHPWGDNAAEGDALPNSRGGIERSFITINCKSIGAFPWRNNKGGLDFPADGIERMFNITGWEFLAALETGHLKQYEILKVLTLPLAIDFKSYVNYFYQMKENAEKNTPRYEFAKRFMNSLYGKFGANPEEYREYTAVDPRHIESAEMEDGYLFCTNLDKWALMSRRLSDERQHYYNVATAASVTGANRAVMWRALCEVKGAIYCDTDAIWCHDTGTLVLHPSNLGEWDIEAECDFGAIAGKKMYAAKTLKGKWKIASKGVRLKAEEIIQIANGNDFTYISPAPQYSIKNGVRFVNRKIAKSAK